MPDKNSAWRCAVCGYIHRGSGPPDVCPVCGASRDDFEPYRETAPPAAEAVDQWRCLVCKYAHHGEASPDVCPVCGALADSFEPASGPSEKTAEAGEGTKAVIVGAGIAGIAAVESLREASPAAEITLVSREPGLPYYRLNLTRYLAGEIGAEDLPIHTSDWYRERNVRLLLGVDVSALRLKEQAVELGDGESLPFQKLLLAAGTHPFVPPFPGANLKGVTTLRTVEDADRILEAIRAGTKCVLIGGGILGLETAAALARRGADVALLEGHGWLLPRQLSQRAGDILTEHAAGLGITLYKKARTREILGDGRVRGVLLEDGTVVAGDLVVIATGVRPNSRLARLAGIEVGQGVVVNDRLETSHPHVFAAGDVAEHRGIVYGTWGPSQYQGSIAALNMAGAEAEFGGIPRSNTLKVLGLDLFSIGQTALEDGSFEAVEEESDGRYFRFVFRDSYLIGAILLGDTHLTARVKSALENKRDLSAVLQKRPNARDLMEFLKT
ncbi:MAG: FAD-dependent oxidoreductase [Planctomycetota bacterium]